MAINNSGLVTGTGDGRAFLFSSKTMEFEFLTEQVTGWRGVDINKAGAIIGATDFGFSGNLFGGPSGSAFYWDRRMEPSALKT
ncbi:MAG: hypothetical protein JWL81_630 [Verrucomicrobiales bacterium]|nr:hypothetical protein [Verrucomicrobiales bacterium]